MPYSSGYNRRRRISTNYNRRRRRLPESSIMVQAGGRMVPVHHAQMMNKIQKALKKHAWTAMKDFAEKAKNRPKGRPMMRGGYKSKRPSSIKPIKYGKAGTKQSPGDIRQDSQQKSRTGAGHGKLSHVVHTHPRHRQPKWKLKRHREYKHKVYQTLLISRPARLQNTENCLIHHRHPTRFPEAKDFNTQTVIIKPFCSEWSGIHTMHYMHVNSTATGLTDSIAQGDDGRFDVIQHKAPSQRKTFDAALGGLDGQYQTLGQYTRDTATTPYTWADVNASSNLDNIFAHLDNMVKEIDFSLEFISSRNYIVDVSISVVRWIKETTKFNLSTDDVKNLTNSVTKSRGLDYDRMVVEFEHKFSIPALQMNKKIPSVKFKKKLLCSFMQKNDFETRDVAGVLTESNTQLLGTGVQVNKKQIADGNEIGNFAILISYKKRKSIQQFTYEQSLAEAFNGAGYNGASIRMPVVTTESFDVPQLGSSTNVDGLVGGSTDGSPLKTSQGDESQASFFCQGKISTCFAFKEKVDQYPSVTSVDPTATKKPLSLNLSHFIVNESPVSGADNTSTADGHALYCRSVDHTELP